MSPELKEGIDKLFSMGVLVINIKLILERTKLVDDEVTNYIDGKINARKSPVFVKPSDIKLGL